MIILDANAILRCILQDHEESAVLVHDQMLRDEFLLLPEVIAEMVYVLQKVYHYDRNIIAHAISTIVMHENAVVMNKQIVQTALHYFGETTLDFVDCLLRGHAAIDGHQVLTFDKQLQRFLNNV